MGYNSRFKLSFESRDRSPHTTEVVEFFDFDGIKDKPYAEIRKQLAGQNVEEYFARMEALHAKAKKLLGDDYGVETIRDCWLGRADEMKWYDHEEDMKKFSKLFPKVLFTMRGEGEEAEDIWVRYYLGGKVQLAKAQISFEAFDEKKLK